MNNGFFFFCMNLFWVQFESHHQLQAPVTYITYGVVLFYLLSKDFFLSIINNQW